MKYRLANAYMEWESKKQCFIYNGCSIKYKVDGVEIFINKKIIKFIEYGTYYNINKTNELVKEACDTIGLLK
jgi:hypothetical protein